MPGGSYINLMSGKAYRLLEAFLRLKSLRALPPILVHANRSATSRKATCKPQPFLMIPDTFMSPEMARRFVKWETIFIGEFQRAIGMCYLILSPQTRAEALK